MRLIDADALKQDMFRYGEKAKYTVGAIDRIIDNAPTVKRPHGKWVDIDSFVSKARCSKCKNIMLTEPYGKTDFCPNCGAEMRGERE